jgi:hypothetical protein
MKNILENKETFALQNTHGFGFGLDSWIFMDILGLSNFFLHFSSQILPIYKYVDYLKILKQNINRVNSLALGVINTVTFIKTCLEWEYPLRSFSAFIVCILN